MKTWIFKALLFIGICLFIGCCVLLKTTTRAGVETPDYNVVKRDQQQDATFEIRSYDDMQLVTTSAGKNAGTNGSFMQLFRYISGDNAGSEKIAMTTPVIMEREKQQDQMSFILPAKVKAAGAPSPKGAKVSLKSLPALKLAVHRFKGTDKPATEAAASAKLMRWVQEQKLSSYGEPFFAYYDPPWTPLFLRKNEVMVRLR
jgi:hypothetical protein